MTLEDLDQLETALREELATPIPNSGKSLYAGAMRLFQGRILELVRLARERLEQEPVTRGVAHDIGVVMSVAERSGWGTEADKPKMLARLQEWRDRLAPLRSVTTAQRPAPLDEAAPPVSGQTSDGYHTFDELYEYRKAYHALLTNEWARQDRFDTHKSWRHSDGELCFGGGWFIVVAETSEGQISNHYKAEDWDLFLVPERERGNVYDGHTPQVALARLLRLAFTSAPPEPLSEAAERGRFAAWADPIPIRQLASTPLVDVWLAAKRDARDRRP
jgi:hypothetical protein